MSLFKKITASIFVLASSLAQSDDLAGRWTWDENSESSSFTVHIDRIESKYVGWYCAVGIYGARVDCSPNKKKSFEFPFTGINIHEFKFVTNYSGSVGEVQLTLLNNKLYWNIVGEPYGEHYAQAQAVLSKTLR
mgnify:FL=1